MSKTLFQTVLVLLLLAFTFIPAAAEVLDSSESGFSIQFHKKIKASPEEVYGSLIDDINLWWDSDHTFSGDANNLSLDARPGGCFCENLSGGSLRHLVVIYADKGKLLRMSGGLGPLQALAVTGTMTFTFKKDSDSTLLTFEYNVSGYLKGGLTGIAVPVDSVLDGQLLRLKKFVESKR